MLVEFSHVLAFLIGVSLTITLHMWWGFYDSWDDGYHNGYHDGCTERESE